MGAGGQTGKAEIWHELIREGAYAIWEQEGKPDGRDLDHWLQAEAEIWHDVIQKRAYALWEHDGRPAGRDRDERFSNWPVHDLAPWVIPST
jgi:Protein of unknown function (DUF2934)